MRSSCEHQNDRAKLRLCELEMVSEMDQVLELDLAMVYTQRSEREREREAYIYIRDNEYFENVCV